jgi:branched-chain amino acid transport system permease protein
MRYIFNNLLVLLGSYVSGSAMHLAFSVAGVVFLGMPTIGKLSAYSLAMAQKAGVAPELAALLAIATACLLGVAFAWLFVKVSADSFAVIGLASILASEALLRSWDRVTNGSLGLAGLVRPDWLKDITTFVVFAAVIALIVLFLEWVLLRTWVGRALRAYREDEVSIQAMGVNIKRVVQNLIILGGVGMGLAWIIFVWKVQLVTPDDSGINFLIELLTLTILASRPLIRDLVLAATFVYLMPEFLRFFNFSAAVFAQARIIAYALILIILILRVSDKLIPSKRRI